MRRLRRRQDESQLEVRYVNNYRFNCSGNRTEILARSKWIPFGRLRKKAAEGVRSASAMDFNSPSGKSDEPQRTFPNLALWADSEAK